MSKKNNNTGGGGNYSNVVRLAAFWALILAAAAELTAFIFKTLELQTGLVGTLQLVGNIFLIFALGLAAWDFTKGKRRVWRILLLIAMVVLILFRVLNFGNWF